MQLFALIYSLDDKEVANAATRFLAKGCAPPSIGTPEYKQQCFGEDEDDSVFETSGHELIGESYETVVGLAHVAGLEAEKDFEDVHLTLARMLDFNFDKGGISYRPEVR